MGELSSYDLGNAANNNNNNNMSLANNLSDIERGRGGGGAGGGPIASPTNDTASNLIQVPVGRVFDK